MEGEGGGKASNLDGRRHVGVSNCGFGCIARYAHVQSTHDLGRMYVCILTGRLGNWERNPAELCVVLIVWDTSNESV